MQLNRFRRQDGFVRETIKYFAIFVVFLVMVLDAIAVIQGQIAVRDNASVAATEAQQAYVGGQTTQQAQDLARTYVIAKGSKFVNATFSDTATREDTVVTVMAERQTHTYLYHYLSHLPWGIGHRVDNLLNPTASGTSD